MFTIRQPVTVIDGGWTGTIAKIDPDLRAAYIRFPGRPDLVPYAFEALTPAGMLDALTAAQLGMLRSKLYSAGRKASQVAHCLGSAALQLPILSDEHNVMWAQRARFTALMNEAYELAELAETPRPRPVLLDGCSCGGIGTTGSHAAGCAWAAR